MSPDGRDRGRSASLLRILVYYLVLAAAVAVLIWRFPQLADLVSDTRRNGVSIDDEIASTFAGNGGGRPGAEGVPEGWAGVSVTVLSLVGSFLVMVPVAWTYIFIKRRQGYSQSVVHTLLILPVAVTGIVLIVRSSLALAFSLAGIVAAVRFRTTLEDTKDAVYVFLAIGIGLAWGVVAWEVAIALSMVFNIVNLLLWRLSFGNVYVDKLRRTGGMDPGDAVAGAGSAESALRVGDPRVMAALSPKELKDVAAGLARMDRYLDAEADTRKERKHYLVLMVYTETVGAAQAAVEPQLERLCVRWNLAEIVAGAGDVSILEYLVRLRGDALAGTLLDAVRAEGAASIQAAEIRSLRALGQKTGA